MLAKRNCPAIQLWDCDSTDFDFSAGPCHAEAGRLVARHFLERGLRRVAYVGAELDKDLCARRRYLTLQSSLAAEGVDLVSMTSDDKPRQAETGRILMEQLMRAHPDIQAVHFLNDAMALGGLSYLHEAGIAVPDGIAVVEFNGTSIPNRVRTKLTTIDVPRAAIGETAAQALLDILAKAAVTRSWRAAIALVQGNTTTSL